MDPDEDTWRNNGNKGNIGNVSLFLSNIKSIWNNGNNRNIGNMAISRFFFKIRRPENNGNIGNVGNMVFSSLKISKHVGMKVTMVTGRSDSAGSKWRYMVE